MPVGQCLADGVDLIVVAGVWKRKQLGFKIGQPWRLVGEKHLSALELARLDGHAGALVLLWLDRNGRQPSLLQFGDERRANTRVLDQDPVCLVGLRVRNGARLERWIIESDNTADGDRTAWLGI